MSFSRNRVEAFAKTFQKSQIWVDELRDMLGFETAQQAYHALRAVLHALRDRLPLEEIAQLSAQLPMLIRGMFYEGFDPSERPLRLKTPDDFYDRVAEHYRGDPFVDIPAIVDAVFDLLRERVSDGEICDVALNMPDAMKPLWI